MTSPADKLRRGEYPEFSSGPLTGGPMIGSPGEGSKAVEPVPAQAVAAAQPKQGAKLTVISYKPPSKVKASPAPAVRQVPLTSPSSVALANVSGFSGQQSEFSIGPHVDRQNIKRGALQGWHVGAYPHWEFHGPIIPTGNPVIAPTLDGVKFGFWPGSSPGAGLRTAGFALHERPKGDATADRYHEVVLLEDDEIRVITGRDDDLLPYLPIKFGTKDAAGVFTERVVITGTGTDFTGTVTGTFPVAAHKTTHEDGGADEISVENLLGVLAQAQQINVRKNTGSNVGLRPRLNFIEGSNVTLTVADDGTDNEIDVTIAAAGGTSDLVFTATPADFDISEVTDVQIVSRDVADVAAGDQLIVEGSFSILNDSGAARIYDITLDVDGAFDIEVKTGSLANSATSVHPIHFHSFVDIRSSSLAYQTVRVAGFLASGTGGNVTMSTGSLHATTAKGTTNDLTVTATVTLHIRSANANPTQTCRLHSLTIRKVTPT